MPPRRTVHAASDRPQTSRCGWMHVDVEVDLSKVTCKACLRMLTSSSSDAASAVAEVLASLTPTASPPPRLTPATWASSCRGGQHRCRRCLLCTWEAEAERWAGVSAWTEQTTKERLEEGRARWRSVNGALLALAAWERDGRAMTSPLGIMLRRVRDADTSVTNRDLSEVRQATSGAELVPVRKALEKAFPERGHDQLTQTQCIGLLLARTHGVLAAVPAYADLADELGVEAHELQRLVRYGRAVVGLELVERGIVREERHVRVEAVVAMRMATRSPA